MVTSYLLTGDIGGTNSRMSLYEAGGKHVTLSPSPSKNSATTSHKPQPLVEKTYRNALAIPENERSDPSVYQRRIISPFLRHCWETLADRLAPLHESEIIACLATAGLVRNNAVRITNLGFVLVDGTAIEKDVSDEALRRITVCQVINDFVAQGYGCLTLTESDVRHLHGPKTGLLMSSSGSGSFSGSTLQLGPKVCVGAGTGLGECYLTPDSGTGRYSCYPSEGGHVEYAPRNDLEVGLWKFLMTKYQTKHRVSVERVVSGLGLANVYEYLSQTFPTKVDPNVQSKFNGAGDEQGRVVGENAGSDPLCRQAMDVMMAAYGCEVGSAAIKWIPLSGIFVTGGLTPKNLQYIEGENSEFMKSYLHKGRVSPLLESIPLYAVLTEDLGVRGVHKAATFLYEKRRGGPTDKVEPDVSSSSSSMMQLHRDALLVGATVVFGFAAGLWIGATRR